MPINCGGQTTLITAAMALTPAPISPRNKANNPWWNRVALSCAAVAYCALLTEFWDLGGGHGNWAEIIYSDGGLAEATSMRL